MMSFHAVSRLGQWDEFGLAATRYLLMGASAWAAYVCGRMLIPQRRHTVGIVPRPVVWFAFMWNLTLALFVFTIAALDADPVSTGWGRTFYAVAIVWALFGMTWIVAIGTRTTRAAIDVVEALDRAVEEANRRAGAEADAV